MFTPAMLEAVMRAAGGRPLLIRVDPPRMTLGLSITADGTGVVLGLVDEYGDDAVVTLDSDEARALRDALNTWLLP